ncbi:type II TA system antitoxin MqsA family protein [Fuchsiella alkaliacetigena]|uniref:type II TA system antitoxin MqsA family protein n=1 Tax=Fuchsiella alkaliacetigena TaxID=957042 RepID=UPI00200B9D41|nr:type II TA system antitoxin MqsA family protein [Fuchsiella alkaliacetigena]MCK8823593.1 type II toxin-antitoxin system MqsA family antitoxin [Fuchsiella alkaliacetigena]
MEKDRLYCDKCEDLNNYFIEVEQETFNIMDKEKVTIKAEIAKCSECKNSLFQEELEEKNQKKAFDLYRENNNLLFTEQIKEIRNQYGLTQKEMSKLLGWGEITYHRYENGCIPSQAHNNQLTLMKDPRNVKRTLKEGNHNLNEEAAQKLAAKIDKLISNVELTSIEVSIPVDFYEELELSAKKLDKDVEEYVLYLLTQNHLDSFLKNS